MSGTPTAEVYRIDWLPGTDVLHGVCHCGAERTAEDPVELWQWMLAHPNGHHPAGPSEHQPTGHRKEPRS
ncbi:hypothetical protein JK364_16830 [Streptomyces sp. 110]|uniref:Uncharacterized protein n=1 Tax=Streptomyces endocoffeicus TaxID=2898945 RepID=A0ABS1PNS4_9ACTN|nr:hypothetical protein [Streptomyces endocoffeicus]MBL1114043.1 hypothetical protein [Streptomyces endocoffeicus]